MTLKEVIKQLESLGNEKRRAHNTKYGAGDNQFGVQHGDIRVLAKKIKTNHELAMALWKTGTLMPSSGNSPDQAKELVNRRDGPDGAVRHLCACGGLAQLLCRQAASRQRVTSPRVDGH